MSAAVKAVQREQIEVRPQPGPQYQFLASQADVVIYGGAAGGGKTYGLLLDPLRHYDNPHFGGVIFRSTSVQVRNEGGLWDESVKLYSLFGAKPREFSLEWKFPKGMSMSFSNLERDVDVLNYQGSQIPWIGFDELTHFSEYQFFYMFSRNRSASGVKPVIRGTCNPDPKSWVKRFIRWWLDKEGRYADPEKAGKLRWFIKIGDTINWADTKEELFEQFGRGPEIIPTSATFIPAKLEDNKIFMQKDPAYKARLLALSRVDRARLLGGDWAMTATAGTYFQRDWFPIVDAIPSGWMQVMRFWDRAATKPSELKPDPDWTRGLKLYKYPNGTWLVADLKSMRDTPGQVEELIKTTASHDTWACAIRAQQDPGSAGVSEADNFIKMLAGYDVGVSTYSVNKAVRAKPVSAQAERHNILVLRADWNDEFFEELENFSEDDTEYAHDDIVDTLSGAFNELAGGMSTADIL